MGAFESEIFSSSSLNEGKAFSYGFTREGSYLVYRKSIVSDSFLLTVLFKKDGTIETILEDASTHDSYSLYKLPACHGEYVGSIREEVKTVLLDIKKKCGDSAFDSEEISALLSYCKSHYGDEVDFPFDDGGRDGVLRHKDSKKWYAVFMEINYSKLGLEDKIGYVVALKGEAKDADGHNIFPGFHMNKKCWVSLPLDGRLPLSFIEERIDKSFLLTKGHGGNI